MNTSPESTFARSQSTQIQEAMIEGMLRINHDEGTAVIFAPPDVDGMTDGDWLDLLRAASEIRKELEKQGIKVKG